MPVDDVCVVIRSNADVVAARSMGRSLAERCGFGSAALLRHHFRKVVGVPPADYRRTFCRSSA